MLNMFQNFGGVNCIKREVPAFISWLLLWHHMETRCICLDCYAPQRFLFRSLCKSGIVPAIWKCQSNFHLMEKPTGKENICMLPSMRKNLRPGGTGSVHDPKHCGHLENPADPRVVPVYSLGSVVHIYLTSTAAPLCQQNWQEGARLQ